ncbi:MAG: response regulator [Hyphomonadaceae bacterium]
MSDQLRNINVLLVDDHAFMRSIWRAILIGLGVTRVREAADAADAFQLMQDAEFDLVIVDYHLADLNGGEFTRLVRQSTQPTVRFVPLLACTADTRPSILRELINAGVDEILSKPISSQVVWRKLHTIVENRRPFLSIPGYAGPDRRRQNRINYRGPMRRASDTKSDCA